jgi:hypothetical protein
LSQQSAVVSHTTAEFDKTRWVRQIPGGEHLLDSRREHPKRHDGIRLAQGAASPIEHRDGHVIASPRPAVAAAHKWLDSVQIDAAAE